MTNIDPFQYSFRSYDMKDVSDESKDLLDSRDKQIENYFQTQKTAVDTALNGKGDTRTWNTWTPTLTRGTTGVVTSTTWASYTITNNLVIVNCEAAITDTTSFPGNQILRFGLPVFADVRTRVLGTGMFAWAARFWHCMVFIEGSTDSNECVFVPDGGQPWLGQTLTNNPTISGVPTNSQFYMNLCFRLF